MKEVLSYLFLTSLLSVLVSSLELYTTHTTVIPGLSTDITLACSDGVTSANDPTSDIDPVTRIQVLKLDKNDWVPLAEVVIPDTNEVKFNPSTMSDVQGSGGVGPLTESYLNLTWAIGTDDVVGTYKCVATVFVLNSGVTIKTESPTVDISNNSNTPEGRSEESVLLLELVDSIRDLNLKMAKFEIIHEKDVNQIRQLIFDREEMGNDITRKHVMSLIKSSRLEERYWPLGEYSLLAANTGCPESNFIPMYPGFISLEHETNRVPKHLLSGMSHMKQPLMVRKGYTTNITLSYCSRLALKDAVSVLWPAGSYCIRPPSSRTCPSNFGLGDVNFKIESSSSVKVMASNAPYFDSSKNAFFDLSYCCRNDGSPNVPIRLPTTKPFYLYRYKGKCQAVHGMTVVDEWFEIETDPENTNNYDFSIYPDSSLDNLRIQLCYYSKQDD